MALLAEYGFNEGSGTTAADSSDNGRNLTATDSVNSWAANGYMQSAATGAASAGFSGVTGPNASQSAFTIMARVYINSAPAGHFQIFSSDSQNLFLEIGGTAGGTRRLTAFLNTAPVESTAEIPINTWTHVAVVASSASGGTVTLYIDGVADGSGSGGQFATKNFGLTCHVGYGDNGTPYDYIDGNIDDLRVFDTALNADEIAPYRSTPIGKGVIDTLASPSGTSSTWFNLARHIGKRVIVVVADRGGGETASMGATQGIWDFELVASRVTNPLASDRRSVYVFTATVPVLAAHPIFSATVLNGSGNAVDHTWVGALINSPVGMPDSYVLAATAGADSGSSAVTSQPTGTTTAVPAGDLLIISAASLRGDATVDWTTTTDNPPMPGGGTWDLNVADSNGTAANRRRASMGYAELPGQTEQTWNDTMTLSTARITSAVIAVWSTGAGGGPSADFEGWGVQMF